MDVARMLVQSRLAPPLLSMCPAVGLMVLRVGRLPLYGRIAAYIHKLWFLLSGLAVDRKFTSTVLRGRLFLTLRYSTRELPGHRPSRCLQRVALCRFRWRDLRLCSVRAAAGVKSGERNVVGDGVHPGADAHISAVRGGEVSLVVVVVVHVRMINPLRVNRGPRRGENGRLWCKMARGEVGVVPGTWRPRGHRVRSLNKASPVRILRLLPHDSVHIAVTESATGRHF
ncbi:hypothetical protein EYF80_029436 [Liparis tanakae]|uniref:Uncharacterized protein n=1 Tax=Liparis tanakae TaxID=230148 RepID=A0A4Z2H4Z0_9TELE|nr:hypothetical protein EYF80_029436 [Liparis tanakae]